MLLDKVEVYLLLSRLFDKKLMPDQYPSPSVHNAFTVGVYTFSMEFGRYLTIKGFKDKLEEVSIYYVKNGDRKSTTLLATIRSEKAKNCDNYYVSKFLMTTINALYQSKQRLYKREILDRGYNIMEKKRRTHIKEVLDFIEVVS